MAMKLKWPILGIVIPVLIIGFISTTTSYVLFINNKSTTTQVVYLLTACILWLSYYLAVMVPPGSPPSNYTVIKDANPQIMWYKYCTKCKIYKPERCHHCKVCKRCVLKMDHHCPFTLNCVGYYNLAHFVRFLSWIVFGTMLTMYHLVMRMVDYYDDRNLPHYLISKTEVTLVLLSFILNFLVLVTISLLLMRTIHNLVYNRTTIEGWEQEKVETQIHTERFWRRVRSNYQRLHGRPLPTLTSWVTNYKTLRANDIIPANFCYDDIVFPYTLNSILQNLELGLGDISTWIWPWGSPNGDGINFAKNTEDEDQLNLPWPPDGSDRLEIAEFQQEISKTSDGEEEVVTEKWANFLGETLDDFGVDLETESYELPKLK